MAKRRYTPKEIISKLREAEVLLSQGAAIAEAGKAIVPGDFQSALDSNRQAKNFFETLDGRNRYAILFRIQIAKKAETRAKQIARFVHMLERHETVHSCPIDHPARMPSNRSFQPPPSAAAAGFGRWTVAAEERQISF